MASRTSGFFTVLDAPARVLNEPVYRCNLNALGAFADRFERPLDAGDVPFGLAQVERKRFLELRRGGRPRHFWQGLYQRLLYIVEAVKLQDK